MVRAVRQFSLGAFLAAWSMLLVSCGSLIADYSLEAYKNATDLKAQTLALVDKSGEPYNKHRTEVDEVRTRISAAHEFSAGTPQNFESAGQWALQLDPDSQLAISFFDNWKAHGTVSATYRQRMHDQIAEGYDTIICLEANKQKESKCVIGGAAQAGSAQ